jgi:hypothetical protein
VITSYKANGPRAALDDPSEEHVDSLHDKVLLGVVRVLLGWDFQDGGDGGVIVLEDVSDVVGDVLVDQYDPNVVPGREGVEGLLHLLQLGVLLNDQEVGSRRRAVPDPRQQEARDGVLNSLTTVRRWF